MKKSLPFIIASVALILALIFLGRSCKLLDRYSVLEGQYRAYKKIADADALVQAKVIDSMNATIKAKDAEIALSVNQIGHLSEAISGKNKDLSELDVQLQAAQSDQERVPILRAEVAAWADKFSLAEQTIAEKDKQIAAWTTKFDAQVVISDAWKTKYEDNARLLGISRNELSVLKTKLRTSRLWGTAKSGVVLCAVGYVAYSMIKGK